MRLKPQETDESSYDDVNIFPRWKVLQFFFTTGMVTHDREMNTVQAACKVLLASLCTDVRKTTEFSGR